MEASHKKLSLIQHLIFSLFLSFYRINHVITFDQIIVFVSFSLVYVSINYFPIYNMSSCLRSIKLTV